ncbi:MAG: DUF3631 domain-containing protein [Magnetococcales bacterium]|nr:DUF3631 domain-containing protein [Magnetococcales bacterium]
MDDSPPKALVETAHAAQDAGIAKRRTTGDRSGISGQGRPLALEPPIPWPEPVDGGQLLADLARVLTRHVCMERGCPTAIALWVLHTHAFDAAQISPRLAVVSPEKRCGKSTLLTVLGGLVPKPLHLSNITAAAVFRAIEVAQPTLLIDEADTFVDGKDELRGILNCGHNRATATVLRVGGEELEVRAFCTWAPLAIAAIGRLPDTLQDRSIVISMRRKLPTEQVERLRLDRLGHLHELARKAARWANDNLSRLKDADPVDIPDCLSDRGQDNWRTLLAIADAVGGGWPDCARRAIRELAGEPDEDEGGSIREMLLADIRAIWAETAVDVLTTESLLARLTGGQFADHPWATFDRGRAMSPRALANLLKPFGIRPSTNRVGGTLAKGYRRQAFLDAFKRYIPADTPILPVTSGTSSKNNELDSKISVTQAKDVTAENARNSLKSHNVSHVTDKEGYPAGKGGERWSMTL